MAEKEYDAGKGGLSMSLRAKASTLAFIIFVAFMLHPQTPSSQSGIHIENVMTVSEFRASGLAKLSPSELMALDAWLNSYMLRVMARLNPTTTSATASVIESQIDGEFHGWDGETIFKLTNGQIWQQSAYDYEYEYDFRPDVTIYKTASGAYKMQVKGMQETVFVKRIK